jgi:hypothetical protein
MKMSNVRRFWFFIPYSPQEDTRPGAKLAYTCLVGGLLCTLFAWGGGYGARKPGLYNGLLGVVGDAHIPDCLGFPKGLRHSPATPLS